MSISHHLAWTKIPSKRGIVFASSSAACDIDSRARQNPCFGA